MAHEKYLPRAYKYTSTKEYHDAFPCAYRQWRADSHCNLIHGYSFSMKFYFGTDDLDVRRVIGRMKITAFPQMLLILNWATKALIYVRSIIRPDILITTCRGVPAMVSN